MVMAYRTDAYRADTGELFSTLEEAERAEIRDAANILGGVSTAGLLGLVEGGDASDSAVMRDALRRLARALPPEPAEPSPSR